MSERVVRYFYKPTGDAANPYARRIVEGTPKQLEAIAAELLADGFVEVPTAQDLP